MERIFSTVINFARRFTELGLNYYISIGLFALCMLGAFAAVIGNCMAKKKKRGSAWLFVMYLGCLIVNVALCLSESLFKRQYFKSPADAYAFCFSQFAVCMIFWLMLQNDRNQQKETDIKAVKKTVDSTCMSGAKCPIIDLYEDLLAEYKAIVNKNERQRRKADIAELPQKTSDSPAGEIIGLNEERADDLQPETNNCDVAANDDRKRELPDINVAYVNNLIAALLAKNIQPDEREKLQELKVKMNVLPTSPGEISELNALLRFLLKKIAEYDIPA